MFDAYQKGHIVLYRHTNNNRDYVGIVLDNDRATDEDGSRLYFVQFWSVLRGQLGNRLYLKANQMTMIGMVPEGVEWDIDD